MKVSSGVLRVVALCGETGGGDQRRSRGLLRFHLDAPSNPVWAPKPAASKFQLRPRSATGEALDAPGGASESTSSGWSRSRRSKIENRPVLSSPAE